MLVAKPNAKHGSLEFNRMQELVKDELLSVVGGLVKQYGILRNGVVGLDKFLVAKTTALGLSINAGTALLKDAEDKPAICLLGDDYALQLPNYDATYKIAIKHKTHSYESGTITTAMGDNTIVGDGTEFTKILGANRSIIINNYLYPVMSVTDDTHLELTIPYPNIAESGVQFSVGGYFVTSVTNVADNLIYEHNGIEIIATTNALTAYEYLLAEATVVSGNITAVVDKRDLITLQMNLFAPAEIWIPHTFTVQNEVKLVSSSLHYIMPFFMGKPAGQTIQIVACVYKIQSGTSAKIKITKNGSDIAALTDLTVTTTKTKTTPATAIELADEDEINMVVIEVTGAPMNLSCTLLIKYSI